FPQILQAFAAFRERHPDAVLYLHTELTGRNGGVNLPVLVESLELPQGSVLFADQYRYQFDPYSPELMGKVYSTFDVLLNPAKGEGFGLTPLEAQACGTPVIVTDFSAMKEVCGAGWKCEYDLEWTPQLSWQANPRVVDIVDALGRCYSLPEPTRSDLSAQAVEHAAQYDADRVMQKHFLPAMEEVAERFADREPQTLKAVAA
ncbi:MAG: glycosyltransferase, partial [Deltaproteobacteria bacterium]|nr:glycosyltransferase [Deltaproteobacteria bacterium]